MSVKAALAFMDSVNDDASLQTEIQALEDGDLRGLVSLASQRGFSFSGEDWTAALSGGELADEQLEAVAGGTVAPRINPVLRRFTIDFGRSLNRFEEDF